MNELGMGLAPWKRRGEWAELKFMSAATEHGLCVSKPWGETSHYDFVVEGPGGRLLRVQVKSMSCMWHGGYSVNNTGSQGMYPANAYDFMAAYVIPLDTWFLIPEEMLRGKRGIQVQHKKGRSKYEKYREAWELLGGQVLPEASPADRDQNQAATHFEGQILTTLSPGRQGIKRRPGVRPPAKARVTVRRPAGEGR